MDFLGIKNVIDAKAIIGSDGMADGFDILYKETRTHNWNGKTISKEFEKRKTVWVREYKPEIKPKTKVSKKSAKKNTKLNSAGLATVAKILGK